MIGFGSKEQAFRGSQTYLENPVFPRKKTVVYLNLSMVGCGDTLHARGAENFLEQWKYLSRVNEESNQPAIFPEPYANPGRPELDADIFLDKGIPSISFRASGAPTYPRTMRDTVKTITPRIMERLSKFLYEAVLDMANTNQDFFKE
jgi:Zn-dependent M28 family amino/carboxypeptidase